MGDWNPENPFEGVGNTYQFFSTTPVDVNRLQDAIAADAGVSADDLMVSAAVQDFEAPVSEANPQTIFVSSQTPLKQKDIQALLDGGPLPAPEPVATTPAGVQIVSDDPDLPEALDKLRSDKTLSTKELSLVLKSIVGG